MNYEFNISCFFKDMISSICLIWSAIQMTRQCRFLSIHCLEIFSSFLSSWKLQWKLIIFFSYSWGANLKRRFHGLLTRKSSAKSFYDIIERVEFSRQPKIFGQGYIRLIRSSVCIYILGGVCVCVFFFFYTVGQKNKFVI